MHAYPSLSSEAAMVERLCYLARTTKVLCSNLGVTRHRLTLHKSLTAVCLVGRQLAERKMSKEKKLVEKYRKENVDGRNIE
jgi:hypothetical protein